MKILLLLFTICLLPIPAFAVSADTPDELLKLTVEKGNEQEVYQAILQGPKNIDAVLKKQLAAQYFNYPVVKVLEENSSRGIDAGTLDKMYADFVIGGCPPDQYTSRGKAAFIKNISRFYRNGGAAGRFRNVADLLGFVKRSDSSITSIIGCVAQYGGDAEFLDMALEFAEKYDNTNVERVVLQIKDEIDKLETK